METGEISCAKSAFFLVKEISKLLSDLKFLEKRFQNKAASRCRYLQIVFDFRKVVLQRPVNFCSHRSFRRLRKQGKNCNAWRR